MKKAIVFFLAVLYVFVTSGVIVNIHYCMGNISSVNYGTEKVKACENCGMQQKKGCCHTEHKFVKSDQAHLSVISHQTPAKWASAVLSDVFLSSHFNFRSSDLHQPGYQSPPGILNNSFHSVLRV